MKILSSIKETYLKYKFEIFKVVVEEKLKGL